MAVPQSNKWRRATEDCSISLHAARIISGWDIPGQFDGSWEAKYRLTPSAFHANMCILYPGTDISNSRVSASVDQQVLIYSFMQFCSVALLSSGLRWTWRGQAAFWKVKCGHAFTVCLCSHIYSRLKCGNFRLPHAVQKAMTCKCPIGNAKLQQATPNGTASFPCLSFGNHMRGLHQSLTGQRL